MPTRWQAGLFVLKTTAFRLRRAWREATRGHVPRLARDIGGPESDGPVPAESRTALYAGEVAAEFALLSAWVEHQSRRLLQAVAAGVPVVASEACGLQGVPGVVSVPVGDASALAACLAEAIGQPHRFTWNARAGWTVAQLACIGGGKREIDILCP